MSLPPDLDAPASTMPDARAEEARAFLESAGILGITITGAAESWRVAVGFAPHERFVVAFSEKNPDTPNDPLYLARQAAAALWRNERPGETPPWVLPEWAGAGTGAQEESLISHETSESVATHEACAMEAPATDALWSPEEEAPDLGAELLEVQDEYDVTEGTISDDAVAEALAEPTADRDHDAVAAEDAGADVQPPERDPAVSPAYPGVAILEDDLGRRRNQVLAAISERQIMLLDVAADPSRRSFLRDEFVRYQNLGALGQPIDAMLQANYAGYMALQARDAAIVDAARQISRAALNADMDGLQRIAEGLEAALR